MTRNIKALGLAFVAVVAMSMTAAAGAQAAELHAATAGANAVLTAEQENGNHVFRVTTGGPNSATVQCQTAHFFQSAIAAKTAQHGTFTGVYGTKQTNSAEGTCTAFGQAARVQMNGCKYTFTAQATPNFWKVDVVGCTAGKSIIVTSAACQLAIPEQATIGGGVTFSQQGQDITGVINATGITYNVTTGALCLHPLGNGTTDGQYTGNITVTAHEDIGTQNIKHTTGSGSTEGLHPPHEEHTAQVRLGSEGQVALTTT